VVSARTTTAGVPLADEVTGRPKTPPKILNAEVKPVTAKENPYLTIFEQVQGPSMLPTTGPSAAPGTPQTDQPAP
jgi:hypothetical protein